MVLFNLIFFTLACRIVRSWTGYKSEFNNNMSKFIESVSDDCKKYYKNNLSPVAYTSENKYGLWPNLVNSYQLKHGQQLFGFQEAIEIIWKNQHEQDCKTANFTIAIDWNHGFGSRIHVEGSGLREALNSNRVYLMRSDAPIHFVNNSHCRKQNISSFECYYLPWSACTLSDALPYINNTSRVNHFSRRLEVEYDNDKVEKDKKVPDIFLPLLKCSPMKTQFYYYWFRAITASYLLRPNQATLSELAKYRKLPIGTESSVNEHKRCVSMHVRHGDKNGEMQLVPFRVYANMTHYLWNNGLVQNSKHDRQHRDHRNKLQVFLGSETPAIFEEARVWAKKSNISLYYSNIFNRSSVSYMEFGGGTVRHELEYLSMLLNLEYALKCDAWICTFQSNTCRVMDELRATVGGKANFHNVDLSIGTCPIVPCIDGNGITNFEWR